VPDHPPLRAPPNPESRARERRPHLASMWRRIRPPKKAPHRGVKRNGFIEFTGSGQFQSIRLASYWNERYRISRPMASGGAPAEISGKVSRAVFMDSRESQIVRFVTPQNAQGHKFFVVLAGAPVPPGQLRIPPVNPFQHIGHLSRRDRHRAVRSGGPDELSTVHQPYLQMA